MLENEKTYFRLSQKGEEDEFHRLYERAVESVKREIGGNYPLIIGGNEVYCERVFEDRSPADRELVLGRFQRGEHEHAEMAVRAAKEAFESWSRTPYEERCSIFLKAADIMAARKYRLAAICSLENGKNRYEAMADVDEAIDFLRYYAQVLLDNHGFVRDLPGPFPGERPKSVLKPYGVWAIISPFNFPVAITTGMTTGAIITGNTGVLKPSSDTPWTAYEIYRILAEAGLPDGVLNYLTGPGSIVGKAILEHDDLDGMVFTGSRDVGMTAYRLITQKRAKPVIAEMGGKNPIIVTEKANLNKAVHGVGRAAFGYDGQKCSACSRVIVHRSIKEEFLTSLVNWAERLVIGDPTRRDVYMGPVINERAYLDYQRYVEIARTDGRILTGGNVRTDGDLAKGYFVEPTIVDGLPEDHFLVKNELFLPILVVLEYRNLEDALRIANDIEYGLTAGIFTEDSGEIQYFFDRIQAGVVYANRERSGSTGAMVYSQPFVGWKMSGTTGKGAGGSYYLQQFLREQSLTLCE